MRLGWPSAARPPMGGRCAAGASASSGASSRNRAGLPAARFHDTRHTYASVLLSGGVSLAAAAEYLGHGPGVLLANYAHLLPGDHDRARSAVEAAFGEAASRVTGVSGC